MNKILLITTVYRTGEKIYPILSPLSKHVSIDVLNMHQMSKNTPWIGEFDSRATFYSMCDTLGIKDFNGPKSHADKEIDAVLCAKYVSNLDKILKRNYYDLVLLDNNITIKGSHISEIYNWFHKQSIKVVACPHGNREFKGYRIHKRIGRMYDYSFVFGRKEYKQLSKIDKKTSNKLICGGIPSNDSLASCKKTEEYILVLPNMIDEDHVKGQVSDFIPFTRKEFNRLGLMQLSEKYHLPIVIKEKNKMYCRSSKLRESMKDLPVKFVMDCPNENEMISKAKCVISAPSTMAFKPIQLGIPTVLLKGHGMIGNFYNFSGLSDRDYNSVYHKLKVQDDQGRDEKFIKETIEGGWEFKSTQVYVDNLLYLIRK